MDELLLSKGLNIPELNTAKLVAEGFSNKEIAIKIFRSEKTVKLHTTAIYKKLQVKNRAAFIVWFMNIKQHIHETKWRVITPVPEVS